MTRLTRYDAACRAIAKAKSVDEVTGIRNKAEAMRAYARQAKNRELEVDAAEIRVRAERRLGELIGAQKRTIGLANGGDAQRTRFHKGTESRPTLAQAGIDKKLSSRAQRLAAVPESRFEGLLAEWRQRVQRENERVTANLLREGEIAQARKAYEGRTEAGGKVGDLHDLIAAGRKFPVIYVDPGWEFRVYSGKHKPRSAERRYDTLSLAEIKGLPVSALAADDSALFLWAVMPELPGALEVITAWGFTYTTVGFTWIKQNRGGQGLFTGMGYWTRANAELCLLATRGRPMRLAKDVHQVIVAPVAEHSRKPKETARRIERLFVGPYLELFGRERRRGWIIWGDEVEPDRALEAAE
jgi:N6-adenosine-specific RNA methylase IME4